VIQELKQALAHVLWIGGATDAGKTTISRMIAERYGFQRYDYDQNDLPQMTRLAETNATHHAFLAASMDERWVQPEPEDLLKRELECFQDRFRLVIEELLILPKAPVIVAEGFGLTPELLWPLLSDRRQAIWLVPTEAFKWASMRRRNKPTFRDQTSDPARATWNLFQRDMLLADHVKAEAQARGLTVWEVDGSRSAEETATLIEEHFAPFLSRPYLTPTPRP
jgi:shikimate kinase